MVYLYILTAIIAAASTIHFAREARLYHQLGSVEAVARESIDKAVEFRSYATSNMNELEDEMLKILDRVEKLEKGIMPDYNETRRAASAVNDFNAGIANILNYNQLDEMRKARDGKEA